MAQTFRCTLVLYLLLCADWLFFLVCSCRSKTETKEGAFKSIQLAPGVVVSAPAFNAAKPAGMFGPGEPDGFIVTVTEAGKPSLDLKVHSCYKYS